MTVKDIKDKFGKLDGSLSKIENILNNASTGVDFYNAYNAYQNAENGSPEQGLAIIDIFNSMFTFGSDTLPPLMGGAYMDAGSWFMEVIENDIAIPHYWDYFNNRAILMYGRGELTYKEAEEYADKCIAELLAARDAMEIAEDINQLDQVFYDIGLINPITGEIDLTVYNNWEDVVKQYAEEHNLFEDGFDEFSAHISNIIGEVGDWFKELYDDLKYGKEITPHEPTRKITSDTFKKFHTASITRYDPLILDLDGDGFNVEKKELGANFDLDKNGFAEKINWTSRYNLKRKRVFDMVS